MISGRFATIATALALGACSGGTSETNNAVETVAAVLTPGEYEIVAKVDQLRSTDQTTPATQSKVGAEPITTRTCVGPDNAVPATAFIEAGEVCSASDSYMKNGRMNLQYKCNRSGKGQLTQLVDGDFKADSFTGTVRTATYYAGSGDYELVRSVTGKRVGDCAARAS